MMRTALLPLGAALTLSACAALSSNEVTAASAALIDTNGRPAGTATLLVNDSGPRVMVEASGLTPGAHGVHIHSVGRCDPPDFTSAGPHWGPTGAEHGRLNPAGPHAGDLGNAMADATGKLSATLPLPRGNNALGDLLDKDSLAIMIHSGRDDERTDPGGDSGARMVCGVLRQVSS